MTWNKDWKKKSRPGWGNPDKLRCPRCGSVKLRLDGIMHGKQRYFCKNCKLHSIDVRPARKAARKAG